MNDIEYRIAELFREYTQFEVVGMDEVKRVIELMGEPEAYGDIDEEHTSSESSQQNTFQEPIKKQFFRDPDDKVIAGVCSGLGHYFGIDPLWVRIIFVAIFLGFGTGFLLYILLAIIIPKAETRYDKMKMKGEPMTVDGIKNSFNEMAGNVKHSIHNTTNKNSGLNQVLSAIKTVFLFLLLIGSSIGIIAVAVGIFSASFFEDEIGDVVLADGSNVWDVIFVDAPIQYVFQISVLLVSILPLIMIMFFSLKTLMKAKGNYRGYFISGVILFVISMGALIVSSIWIAKEFKSEEELASKEYLRSTKQKIFITQTRALPESETGNLQLGIYGVRVVYTDDTIPSIKVVRRSNGKNSIIASDLAEKIDFDYKIDSNVITLPRYFSTNTDYYRGQYVKVNIYLPKDYSYELDNLTNVELRRSNSIRINDSYEFRFEGWGEGTSLELEEIEKEMKVINEELEDVHISIEETRGGDTVIRKMQIITE